MYQEKNLLEELEEIVRLSKQPGQILTRDMREAVKVAEELREIVQETYNTKTNQLNLNQFEQSLKKAGTNLNDVNNKLQQLGAKGTDANSKLSRSVMNVNTQLKETGYLASHAKRALENVAFYNVGVMGVNAFTGKVKEGVKYLKELNKSLTQIREVSGMAEETVRKLAEDGSKIAENIGATTLEYTKAALIYAQQGLTGDELKQRTEITLKLAKVLGQEAQHVSENLTAIWNNYSDGKKTLESYADVIAKLGATTAASTEEISRGLQNLGGIGKTVGLSYEYASSMVATLVATTRESASSVGTSMKTLTARLQDLKLGKTLDDGTTLGKYSKALEAVGVNIKDQNGNLKDMDRTLDELGQKWSTLRRDEQVALAKGVAGVREYSKFATLMNNWEFMKKNVDTAMNSAGELAKQQSVYMESLEAKEQKLAERWEHLFNSEEAEKGLGKTLDLMSNMVGTVDKLVSSFGGLHGALLGIGSMVAFVFRDQIANSIAKSRYEVQKIKEEEEAFDMKKQIVEANKNKSQTKSPTTSTEGNKATLNSLLGKKATTDNDSFDQPDKYNGADKWEDDSLNQSDKYNGADKWDIDKININGNVKVNSNGDIEVNQPDKYNGADKWDNNSLNQSDKLKEPKREENKQKQVNSLTPELKFLTGEGGKGLGKDIGLDNLNRLLDSNVINSLISLTTQRTGGYVDSQGNWSKNGGKKFNQKEYMQTQKFADNLEYSGLKDKALDFIDNNYKNGTKDDLNDIDIIKQIINKGSFTNSQGQDSRKLRSNGETAGAYSKMGELHKQLGSIIGSVSGGGLLGILRNIDSNTIAQYGELQKQLTTDANEIAKIEQQVKELQAKLGNLQQQTNQKNVSYVMNKGSLPKHHDGTDLAKLLSQLAEKRNSGKRIVKKDLGNFLDIYDNIEKLNPDEYLAILQQGEVVFTKKQFESVKQAFLDRDDSIVSKVLDELDKKKGVNKKKKAVDDVPDLTKDINSKLKANQKRNENLKKNNIDDVEIKLSQEDLDFLDSINLKPKKQNTQTKPIQKEEPKQKQQELPKTYEEAKKAVNSLTSAFNSFAKQHKDPFNTKTKSASDKIKVYQKALDEKTSDDYNLTEQEAKEMAKTTKRDKSSGAVVQGLSRKALYEKAQKYYPNTKSLYSKIDFSNADKEVKKNFKESVEGKDTRYIRDSDFLKKEENGDVVADAKQSMEKTKQLFDLVDQTINLIGKKMDKELGDMKTLRDKLKAESEKTSQPTKKTEEKIIPKEDWGGSKDPEAEDFFDDLYEQELHELSKANPLKNKGVEQKIGKDLFADISEERQEYIEEATKLIKEYEDKLKKDENTNTDKEEQKIEDYLQAIRDTDDYIKELTTVDTKKQTQPNTNKTNSSTGKSKPKQEKKEKKFNIPIAVENKTENNNNSKGKVTVNNSKSNKSTTRTGTSNTTQSTQAEAPIEDNKTTSKEVSILDDVKSISINGDVDILGNKEVETKEKEIKEEFPTIEPDVIDIEDETNTKNEEEFPTIEPDVIDIEDKDEIGQESDFPTIEPDVIDIEDETNTKNEEEFPTIEPDIIDVEDSTENKQKQDYDNDSIELTDDDLKDEIEELLKERNEQRQDELERFDDDAIELDDEDLKDELEKLREEIKKDREEKQKQEDKIENEQAPAQSKNMPEVPIATDFIEATPDEIEAQALEREVELTERHLQVKRGLTQEENNRATQLTQLIVEEEKELHIAEQNIGYIQNTVKASNSFIESLRNGVQPVTAIRTEIEKYGTAFRANVTSVKAQEDGSKRLVVNMSKLVQQVAKVEQFDSSIVDKVRQQLTALDKLNNKEKLTTKEVQKVKNLIEDIQKTMLQSAANPLVTNLEEVKQKTREASTANEEYQKLMNKGQLFTNTKKAVTAVTGAMSSMSMAWSSMSSIMQTLEDNEMSLMDKTQQLAMTFGMAGGMFKSVFSEIDRQFGGDGKFFKSLVNNLKMPGVAKELSSVRKEMKTLTVAGKQATKQFEDLAAREQDLSKQLGKGTASKGGVALGVGLIAAMAVMAAWSAALEKMKEQEQALAEARRKKVQEDQEQLEQYNKEVEGLDAVSNGLEDLKAKYDNGQISIGQMRAETYKLCEQYDIEAEKLGVLTGDYEQLAEAVKKARLEKAQEGVNKSETGKTDAMALAKNSTNKTNEDWKLLDPTTWGRGNLNTVGYQFYESVEKGDIDMISSILGSKNVKTDHIGLPAVYGNGTAEFDINNEEVMKNYDTIIKQLNKEVENGSYAAKELLKAMMNEDYINAKNLYLDSLKTEYDQKRKIAELDIYKEGDIKSYQDYAKQRAELKEKYQKDEYGFEDQKDENGKVIKTKDEQIEDYVNNLFMKSGNSTIQGYVAQDERNKQFQDLIVNGNEEQKKELTEIFDTLPTKIQEALLKNKIEVSVTDTAEDLKNKTAGTGDADLTGLSSVDKILQAVKQGNVNESTYQEKREQGKSTDKVENALGKSNESLNSSVQNLIEQYDVGNLMKDFNNKSQEEQLEVLEKVVDLAGRRANFEQQTTGDIEKQKQELEKQQEQLGVIQKLKKENPNFTEDFNTITNAENMGDVANNDFDAMKYFSKEGSLVDELNKLAEKFKIDTAGKTIKEVTEEIKKALFSSGEAVEDFKKKWDSLDDEGKKKLQAELNLDDKGIKSKIEDINNKLKKLTKDPYTVKMEIEDNALSVMQNKVGLFVTKAKDQLADVSQLVKEGFKIDPNDFNSLMKVYPQLGQNAKITSEGMIQMDSKVTKQFLSNKKKEITAEFNKNKAALDAKIGQLKMEYKYYEEQYKLGQQALKDEDTRKNYYALREKNATKFKNQLVGEAEKVVEGSEINAQLANNKTTERIKENLSDISKDILTVGELWSKAQTGSLTGEEKGVSAKGYDADKTNKLTKKQIEDTTDDLYKNYSKEQQEQYVKADMKINKSLMDSTGNMINAYTGQKGQMTVAYQQAMQGINEWGTDRSGQGNQKELQKHIQDTYDKFVNLKQAIDNATRAFDRFNKASQHYYGEQKSKALGQQNKLINNQIKAYKNLERAQARELSLLRTKLRAYANFNKSGQLVDFYSAFNRIKAEYNKAIDTYNSVIKRYNAMTKDAQEKTGDKLLKSAEDNLERAKEAFEQNKSDLEQYKNLMNEYQDSIDKQLDLTYQKIENTMERLNNNVELRIDASQAIKDLHDFYDKFKKGTNKISQNYIQELLSGIADTKRLIDEDRATGYQVNRDVKTHQYRANTAARYIRGAKDLEVKESKGTLTAAEKKKLTRLRDSTGMGSLSEAVEQLKQANKDLLEDYSKIEDAVKDAISQSVEYIEQYKNKISELNGEFDTLNTKLEHQMKLTELVYGADRYDEKGKVIEQQIKVTEDQLEALQNAKDNALKQYKEAKKNFGENSQQAKALYAEYESTAAKVDSLVETYIEKHKEQLKNSINEAYKETEKALMGGSSFDFAYKEWELTKKQQSATYDETERLLQLEKMRYNLQQKIDNTKELKTQQKLKEYADYQLKFLEDKKELTKEDIELAQKRLSVVEAEIALENAQKNKNQMKLTRDSSGNWSYDYVADENDIAKKKEDLLAAQNDVYEFTKNKLIELQENVVKVTQEGLNALQEYDLKMAEIADKESAEYKQLAEEKAVLQEKYFGEEGVVTQLQRQYGEFAIYMNESEMGSVETLCKVEEDNYDKLTAKQKELVEEMRKAGVSSATDVYTYSYGKFQDIDKDSRLAWDTAKDKAQEAMTTIKTYQDTVVGQMVEKVGKDRKTIEEYLDKINDKVKSANKKFTDAMSSLEQKTGISIKNVNKNIGDIGTESDKVKKKMNTWVTDSNKGFTTMNSKLKDILNTYTKISAEINKSVTGNKGLIDSTNATIAKHNLGGGSGGSSSGSGSSGSGSSSSGGAIKVGKKVKIISRGFHDSFGSTPRVSEKLVGKSYYVNIESAPQYGGKAKHYGKYPIHLATKANSENPNDWIGWFAPSQVQGFRTGGYTGNWNNSTQDGKLALLHQKELVLNKEDTEKIFKAVKMVREMGQSIETLSKINFNEVIESSKLDLDKYMKITSLPDKKEENQETNNTFHINAEFPNASNVEEIREAILSLPNLASQYINKR